MKKELASLLHLTLDEMESYYRSGIVSHAVYRAWLSVWTWSAARFAGRAGDAHDRFYSRFGKAAYWARINRVRSAFGFSVLSVA